MIDMKEMNMLLIRKFVLQISHLTQQLQHAPNMQASGSKAPYFCTFAQKSSTVVKKQNSYFCYLCKMKHLVIDNDSERLLVLSDSLNSWKCNNEWQHPGTEKLGPVKGHINMEVKSGATISDLTNILIEKYLNVDHRSINIIFVGGINDVIRGKHGQDILEDIFNLKETVKSHNKKQFAVLINFAIGF